MKNYSLFDRARMIRRLIALCLVCTVVQLHAGLGDVGAQSATNAPQMMTGGNEGGITSGGDKAIHRPIYGRLAINGDRQIAVNGNPVRSGATIITGAQLQTPAAVGASIQLYPLGRVEISPQTTLQLSFGANRIDINLLAGCAVLMSNAGVNGEIRTPEGRIEKSGPQGRDFIDLCAGNASPDVPIVKQGAVPGGGISRFTPLFLFGGVPAGVMSGIYAGRCTGRPSVASPSCGCCCCC